MEMEPERISPTLTSRYMNNYIPNASEIYHQNFHPQRQNIQSFYPVVDNNNRNYLKRHYYDKDEFDAENERDRKYEKLVDHPGHYPHYHQNQIYDSYNNNNLYSNNNTTDERVATGPDSSNNIVITNNNSNDNYPINSSPSSSIGDVESEKTSDSPKSLSNGKKTKGRVKIKMEYIDNKLRRYTTFSKRKTGIMKKAYELSTLTGTQVMLLVASETGHVYTFATRKLQPMITSEAGKALIQTCLNSPEIADPTGNSGVMINEQRMSATGFEETELTFDVQDDPSDKSKVRSLASYNSSHPNVIGQSNISHSHIYNLPPHPGQHYPHSPQTGHHFSSPHYSPPSPSLTSQHFQPPASSTFPSFYENTGNSSTCGPLSSYQSIRPPSSSLSSITTTISTPTTSTSSGTIASESTR